MTWPPGAATALTMLLFTTVTRNVYGCGRAFAVSAATMPSIRAWRAGSSQRCAGGAKCSTIALPSLSSHDTGTRAAATAANAGMPM